MSKHWLQYRSALVVASAVMMFNGRADGAGVAVMEQSVRQLGTAFAGGATADDAATIFYNPAGLTRLSGSQAVAGMSVVFPSAKFRNEGSTHLTGQPLSGDDGGNAGRPIVIPNVYLSHQLTDRVHTGLGIFSPFGLSTEYDSTWVGRYHAVKSDLFTIDINPTIACRVTDKLSLGAGINAQYLKAELSNAIDFGTIFGSFGAPGFAPQRNDGFVNFTLDGWSWGYNLGALYEFTNDTRVGVAYRSRVNYTLTGNAHFAGVPAPNPTGRFADTGITSDVTLPGSASISAWHSLSREIAVMADITWTNWSTLDELRIRFDNPAESDAVTTIKWKDSFRYSVGAVYTPGKWAFRAGAAYEESPVPDNAHRTPRIPDNDRIWLAAGVGYKRGAVSIETGYAHVFISDPAIRKSATGEDQFRGGLSGSYKTSADIVSTGITLGF